MRAGAGGGVHHSLRGLHLPRHGPQVHDGRDAHEGVPRRQRPVVSLLTVTTSFFPCCSCCSRHFFCQGTFRRGGGRLCHVGHFARTCGVNRGHTGRRLQTSCFFVPRLIVWGGWFWLLVWWWRVIFSSFSFFVAWVDSFAGVTGQTPGSEGGGR